MSMSGADITWSVLNKNRNSVYHACGPWLRCLCALCGRRQLHAGMKSCRRGPEPVRLSLRGVCRVFAGAIEQRNEQSND